MWLSSFLLGKKVLLLRMYAQSLLPARSRKSLFPQGRPGITQGRLVRDGWVHLLKSVEHYKSCKHTFQFVWSPFMFNIVINLFPFSCRSVLVLILNKIVLLIMRRPTLPPIQTHFVEPHLLFRNKEDV